MSERAYRAACPGCGAPVEFRSAQSAYAVCSYCQSTVVRDGETLSRIGKMAEVFDDHSPLQLMATGRWRARAFTVVGRLQYRSPDGPWTEWYLLFDDGATAFLSEDNGAYVLALPAEIERELPPPETLRVGATTAIDGKSFDVSSNEQVALVSAQGELPKLPPLNQPFAMVELRSSDGEVLSLDYGARPVVAASGRSILLDELELKGLRDEVASEYKARQFSCPNCGAPVEQQLATTKSLTCRACNALINVDTGIGGELRHALQDEPVEPLIPLGSTGTLQGAKWKVVGYQHRMGWEPDDDDEQFGWDEYLLYEPKRGFIFLVDSTEGWSVVKPTTGAPSLSPNGQSAVYLGAGYKLKYSYKAMTNYVAGEFYWPVERGQRTFNRDFEKGTSVLSMEETQRERTWSLGSQIQAESVAKAFGLEGKKDQFKRGDAGPTAAKGAGMGCGCLTIFLIIFIIIILLALLKACEDGTTSSGSGSSRSSGGSFGGYSSGGGHK
ncbi:DUF4178 domain-containing protein [Ramlibacter albus]|uniref:DUF4178 domain-containing protein n=1 Tax=Ramlibacter albus TaxID=2079448 RepID=A0A923M6Y5_9BURK|nr:DUF4178 domain-containing protein [Ramlibacter albus]MBC5763712.1 DUF4178 domain-containing protein [Ramlibacter albus]